MIQRARTSSWRSLWLAVSVVAAWLLCASSAWATGDTIIGFDDIGSDQVAVTNQYTPLGVTFGSSASFGLNVATNGCGAPLTGSSPPDYDGGGRWIEPPRCGPPGPLNSNAGTVLSFSWPHASMSVWALATPGYSPTLRITGYDSSQNQVAQATQVLSPNYWTHVTLGVGSLDSLFSYVVIDNVDPGPVPEFVLDSLQYDPSFSPIDLSSIGLLATAGSPFSGPLAHLTDGDTTAAASDYSVRITWGDGSEGPFYSLGSVVAAAGGGFDISSTHTYATAGSFPLDVSVTKVGRTTLTRSGTAVVSAPGGGGGGGSLAAPHAAFTSSPGGQLCPGQRVAFDGRGSTPGSSPIKDYEWSFTGPDGVFESYLTSVNPPMWAKGEVGFRASGPGADVTYNYFPLARSYNGDSFGDTNGHDWLYFPSGKPLPPGWETRLPESEAILGSTVSLTVFDVAGLSDTVTRTLSFRYPFISFERGVDAADTLCSGQADVTAPPVFPNATPVTLQGSTLAVPFGCTGGATVCGGLVTLSTVTGPRGVIARAAAAATRSIVVGKARFALLRGHHAVIHVKLNKRGRALARHGRLHKLRLSVSTVHLGAGKPKTVSRIVSVVRSRHGR